MKQPAITLILCLVASVGFSQHIDTAKLSQYLETLARNDKFMGTVCVSRAGENIYSKSVGFSDVDAKTKASQNSTYKIGSISKSFTAVMVFQAIEQGLWSLETTLDKYFPAIENADKISVDMLLSHRSGIHNFTDDDYHSWAEKQKTRDEMVAMTTKGGSDFAPGSTARYSNSNYLLLSYILEIIYDRPYAEILRTNITEPLRLTKTYFGKPKAGETCKSYILSDKCTIAIDAHPSILMGAGGIISTPNDLNIFFHALFNGKLISANSLAQMEIIKDGYGKGLIKIPFYTMLGYGHGGKIDGFQSISSYFPDDQTAYSLTSNGYNYIFNDISIAVLKCVYNMPFNIPSFDTVHLTSGDLDKYLGVYSCPQLPVKLTISKRDKTLVAQGTGQAPFDLEALPNHTFQFMPAGVILIFNTQNGTMKLNQGGAMFPMRKE